MNIEIMIINKFGNKEIVSSNFVPRVGDNIDLFYEPYPIVKKVLAFPSPATKQELGDPRHYDVILFVE